MGKRVFLVTIFNLIEIDRKKDVAQVDRGIATNLSEVFGGDGTFSWHWLLPLAPQYHDYMLLVEYSLNPLGKRWEDVT